MKYRIEFREKCQYCRKAWVNKGGIGQNANKRYCQSCLDKIKILRRYGEEDG